MKSNWVLNLGKIVHFCYWNAWKMETFLLSIAPPPPPLPQLILLQAFIYAEFTQYM